MKAPKDTDPLSHAIRPPPDETNPERSEREGTAPSVSPLSGHYTLAYPEPISDEPLNNLQLESERQSESATELMQK
jgi:hypothetical protein